MKESRTLSIWLTDIIEMTVQFLQTDSPTAWKRLQGALKGIARWNGFAFVLSESRFRWPAVDSDVPQFINRSPFNKNCSLECLGPCEPHWQPLLLGFLQVINPGLTKLQDRRDITQKKLAP
jgi:hypothetical protein